MSYGHALQTLKSTQIVSEVWRKTGTKDFDVCWQVVEKLKNVKQIEVKPNGRAEFSVDMKLRDSNSTINVYKVRQDQTQNHHFNDDSIIYLPEIKRY